MSKMITYEIIKAIISRKNDNNEQHRNGANKNEIEPNNNNAQT